MDQINVRQCEEIAEEFSQKIDEFYAMSKTSDSVALNKRDGAYVIEREPSQINVMNWTREMFPEIDREYVRTAIVIAIAVERNLHK